MKFRPLLTALLATMVCTAVAAPAAQATSAWTQLGTFHYVQGGPNTQTALVVSYSRGACVTPRVTTPYGTVCDATIHRDYAHFRRGLFHAAAGGGGQAQRPMTVHLQLDSVMLQSSAWTVAATSPANPGPTTTSTVSTANPGTAATSTVSAANPGTANPGTTITSIIRPGIATVSTANPGTTVTAPAEAAPSGQATALYRGIVNGPVSNRTTTIYSRSGCRTPQQSSPHGAVCNATIYRRVTTTRNGRVVRIQNHVAATLMVARVNADVFYLRATTWRAAGAPPPPPPGCTSGLDC